jgi:ATPase subunit of ABC transporter with duplicated ATPase domains
MSIVVSGLSFHFPNQEELWQPVSFTVPSGGKVAVVGDNGCGKTTLMRLIAGELEPSAGSVQFDERPYYVPQLTSARSQTIAEALGVAEKLAALKAIEGGSADAKNYDILGDDWNIEDRCLRALSDWGLMKRAAGKAASGDAGQGTESMQATAGYGIENGARTGAAILDRDFQSLSGGEKTKVMLAGIEVHEAKTVMLDEPTNHLDYTARKKLYDWVSTTDATLLVVSHDVTLLNLMDTIVDLSAQGVKIYGGNYELYREQKDAQNKALIQKIESSRTELKKAKKKAQEVNERQQRREAQGARNKQKGGAARILVNAKGGEAENTAAKLKDRHSQIIGDAQSRIQSLSSQLQQHADLKVDIEDARLHEGKMLIKAEGIMFSYPGGGNLWHEPLDFEVRSGDRIQILGDNGSGKTTLLRLMLGELEPTGGSIIRADFTYNYMDQEYAEVRRPVSVLELAQSYNPSGQSAGIGPSLPNGNGQYPDSKGQHLNGGQHPNGGQHLDGKGQHPNGGQHLADHEIKVRLNRALFPQETWDKSCLSLSGGERMRLYLCCMLISNQIPDLFVLDEPTNNLDLSSLSILTETIAGYHGTLLVISHDKAFTDAIGITRQINLGA